MTLDKPVPGDPAATFARLGVAFDTIDTLVAQIAGKADANSIDILRQLIDGKASEAQVEILIQQIAAAALQSTVDVLIQQVAQKADVARTDVLTQLLQSKAPQNQVDILIQQVAAKAEASSISILSQLISYRAPQAQVDILIRQMAERATIVALDALTATVTGQRYAPLAPRSRPGDGALNFGLLKSPAALGGAVSTLPELPASMVTAGDDGRIARLLGAGVVASRSQVAIEPGRVYSVRFCLRRRANCAGPINHAIYLGIGWLDQNSSLLPGTTGTPILKSIIDLRVSDGRQDVSVTISRRPTAQEVLLAPYGAVYARPFVQTFGDDGLTDIEVMEIVDVSGLAVLPDVSADAIARIGALESEDLASRLHVIEQNAQTPNSITFPTRADARTASIPTSVTTLLLRGLIQAGDGFLPTFRRAPAFAPVGPDDFTSADGARWQLVPDMVAPGTIYVRQYLPLRYASDGSVDYTAQIQAALTAGAGKTVEFPDGLFTAAGLRGADASHLTSSGRTILRRPNRSTSGAAVLGFVNKSAFSVTRIVCDGNRGTQTIAANAFEAINCSDFDLTGIKAVNASGCGVVVQNSQDEAEDTRSVLDDVDCLDNDQFGLYLLDAGRVDVTGGDFLRNTLNGIKLDADNGDVYDINFTGVNASNNGQSGLYGVGHKENNTFGTSIHSITVVGGQFNNNKEWGLILQGNLITSTGAITRNNGSNSAHAGLLINGFDITVANHISTQNFYFGADLGDARNVNVIGGEFSYNGLHGAGGIGVNIESAQDVNVSGVMFKDNGDPAVGGQQLIVRGIGGADDASPFLYQARGINITGCHFRATHDNYAGLVIDANADEVNADDSNAFYGFTPNLAVVIDATRITVGRCRGDANMRNPTLPSADTLIIPDIGDFFFVSGNVDIHSIRSARQNRWNGRTRRFDVTAGGSGYARTFDFTLPTGETGRAFVYQGSVVTLLLTGDAAAGADFAFAVPGGGGTGAMGRASVGCNNTEGRKITLMFQGALRIRPGGNISISQDIVVSNSAPLTFLGAYGNFYPTS
ncbi:right-handed parallel beta-helix repeat-containing protein [Methylobacterium brachiatum]|uniref:right-handed parallel beta-helix repeat-containing protein n=1 Tax=Methylobacterium brachiatum TaxID=269660 RepID=UPI000EFD657D|nr:right-handed parallel beta-helix repeat-containing protein [Methylobacterium brachiatum]AYO83651.1 right-handed parallel beta-helix repeat-containing protein [Methylobacterium brachiatum]